MDTAAVAAAAAVIGRALPARILLVDDDELELELMADRLASVGFQVTSAHDGREALEIFGQQWFPLVLTDWNMPLMDGIALTEQLRAKASDETYIIMLSARDDGAAYERGYIAGVDDYLSKRLPDPELLARIEGGFNTLALRRSLKQAKVALESAGVRHDESGAYSAQHLTHQLRAEISRSMRYKRNLSVLVLRFQHSATPGAQNFETALSPDALQSIVTALNGTLRQHADWLARYTASDAGDSFAVVMPETSLSNVNVVRQRLQTLVNRTLLDQRSTEPSAPQVTTLIGAASLDMEADRSRRMPSPAELLRVADLSAQCALGAEHHLRAVQASVEHGVLIPCRLGYAVTAGCGAGDSSTDSVAV